MRIGVLRTFGLALLLAGLACISSVSGQEPKAPAPESLNWLRGQAEKGNPAAQYILGFNYANGQGVWSGNWICMNLQRSSTIAPYSG